MKDLNDYVNSYFEQIKKGDIQKAYASLVKYVMKLSGTLSKSLGKEYSFGNLFQGYMDYTYFYYTNDFLKKRKLKFGLVLNHTKMQFEVWLLGQTIPIQEKYWAYFKSTKWNIDRTQKPQYSILETIIIKEPNFNNLALLTKEIEESLVKTSNEIIEEIKKIGLD